MVWYGEFFGGQQNFKGRSTDTNLMKIPMNFIADEGKQNLILEKQGKGRLYYRIGLNYAPLDLKLKSAQYGFYVDRRYEGVEKPEHVIKMADGSWKIKLGQKVKFLPLIEFFYHDLKIGESFYHSGNHFKKISRGFSR